MKNATLVTGMVFLLSACGTTLQPTLDSRIDSGTETVTSKQQAEQLADRLNGIFDGYFMESLELNPIFGTFLGMRQFNHRWVNTLSPEYRQQSHDYTVKWLDQLTTIDRSQLTGQDQVSYDIFRYQLERDLEAERFPDHLMPVDQFSNFANFLVTLGSGQSAQPFVTPEDYHNWLHRAEGIAPIFDQSITNMRQGITAGVVQPRVLMEKVLPQLAAQLVDSVDDSLFMLPVSNMPEAIGAADRKRISRAYRERIAGDIIPAYRRLHDFIRDEYLPACGEEIGLTNQPDGVDWYNFRIKTMTTTDMDAEQIHAYGLSEVARIRSEMMAVAEQLGFDGKLAEFFTWLKNNEELYFADQEQLLQAYRDIQIEINARLPKLFDVMPKADYEVRPVEAFRAESSAGAYYQQPSPDGSRPGIFYVNTFNLKAQPRYGVETLSLHEASPGHHFQATIQQEIENMPMFRRFGGFTAFAEGWGLYAESLGKELGLFTDPYQYFGRLSDEMLRAMRLVVDTGMHAKGWSREQAIQYMLDNSSLAETDIIAEVERYIALPGQALSYKVGQRIISDLRHEAEITLGDGFDIIAFHRLVLTGGAMPMDVLKQRVAEWIDQHVAGQRPAG